MAPVIGYHPPRAGTRESILPDTDVVELSVLLPRSQAQGLEELAQDDGLTPAQMVRRLVGRALAARDRRDD